MTHCHVTQRCRQKRKFGTAATAFSRLKYCASRSDVVSCIIRILLVSESKLQQFSYNSRRTLSLSLSLFQPQSSSRLALSSVVSVCACALLGVFFFPSTALVNAQSIDVFEVGPLVNTQHQVSGFLYAFNDSLLILDGFKFDGQGAGVFLNVGKSGRQSNSQSVSQSHS